MNRAHKNTNSIQTLMRVLPCVTALTVWPIGCDSPDADVQVEKPAPKPVAVSTSPVIQAEVTPRVTLIGTVTAIQRSTIGSGVSGVSRLHRKLTNTLKVIG